MIEVRKTTIFSKWFDSLKDRKARARIQGRIDRLELGNFGDTAPVGSGVSELRIFYGPRISGLLCTKRQCVSCTSIWWR
jgi:putative addiction module killer protein